MLAGLLALARHRHSPVPPSTSPQPNSQPDLCSTTRLSWHNGSQATRAYAMQAGLAIVSGLLGLMAAWQTKDWRWAVGAVLILANLPYTLLGIIPTNNKLKAIVSDAAGPTSRALIERWGRLHAVRTTLGIAAALAYLWAPAQP